MTKSELQRLQFNPITAAMLTTSALSAIAVLIVWAAFFAVAGMKFWGDPIWFCVATATFLASLSQSVVVDKHPSILGPNFGLGVFVWIALFVPMKLGFLYFA